MGKYRPYSVDDYRRRKKAAYMKATYGIEPFVDAKEVQDHIKHLRTRLSIADIARRAGVAAGTVQAHAAADGTSRPGIRPAIAAALLAVQFGPDDLTEAERLRGALRILRGLYAIGFTSRVIGETTGVIGIGRHPNSLVNMKDDGTRYNPSSKVYTALLHTAEKLETANPLDFGTTNRGMNCNKSRAKSGGWPPIGCWDMDSIHSAESIPDWTGACGTVQGWQIHYRQDIPFCPACKLAKKKHRKEQG